MKIVCDACAAKYSIADEKVAGKVFKIRCKKCSNIIVVRGAKENAAADPQYDEKETRVFDYSGYDSPSDAVADALGGAVWHLVIDQEQVGPMTADEVRQRFSRGELEIDSFVWREGFEDWQRLDAIPEFSDLAGAGGSPADDAAAAMFGGPALDDGAAAAAQDPADLFTAQSGDSADPGGGLFGDVGGDDGGLFGTSEPMAAAPADDGFVDSRLTGQRNENSVLFSLNNLASLASDSPRPSAPSSSAGGGGPVAGAATSSGQEGSGLIDIRAMASMYMGESPGTAKAGGGIDDLPVFSQPTFEAASPVLMPVAAPANNNKVMVALIAGIGALVLVAVILLILVVKGGDDDDKVAASDPGDERSLAAGAASSERAGDSGDKGDKTSAADSGDTADSGDKAAESDKAAEEDKAAPVKEPASAVKREPPKAAKKESAAERRARERKERERRAAAASKPKPEPKAPPSSGGGGCDEITCLVDSSKPCCRKRGGSSGGSASKGGGGSNLPSRPSKSDIKTGMGRVSGAVRGCKSGNFSGRIKVRIRIAGSGGVSSATASGGPASVNSCVSRAVKRARFPKTQSGISITYGYNL